MVWRTQRKGVCFTPTTQSVPTIVLSSFIGFTDPVTVKWRERSITRVKVLEEEGRWGTKYLRFNARD